MWPILCLVEFFISFKFVFLYILMCVNFINHSCFTASYHCYCYYYCFLVVVVVI